ncbi:hypothetical protein SBA6_520018 [Candidatus Sulfopaludibacter sp. SbA6]|nr:hypothetical protein SBA6_520018 [Candidatus Sulfopaludibacter sp. SbA6]
MSSPKERKKATVLDQEETDRLVVSQADDDSAWGARIRVKRSKPASHSIPGERSSPC